MANLQSIANKRGDSWWVPSVIITASWLAFWGVDRAVWPGSTGFTGAVIGTLVGFAIAVTLDCCCKRRSQ